ncbi:phosphotransferase family protein [Altererythrobacter lutimaris]|uniref:Phosphotransferase family protein n=1 Tax=Altererythrobacter lutimaris TaxID=2743979 RepID=A0A850HER6_9SPHN|nr:phosphotransferase family protein [Altererythrobacter lutimaris]NVE95606.1 phosphotransferase family protein [Altererythrobacter lutimaris]
MSVSADELTPGLTRAVGRAGLSAPSGLTRLTGGATMESWRFSANGEDFVLRRAPSAGMMAERPFGHDVEAAIIRAAHAAEVSAPEVITVLEPEDGIGSGFIMRALPGTPDPKQILAMDNPEQLLREAARDLAKIHALSPDGLPAQIPTLDIREGIADFRAQFEAAGGDRPIIALGIKWLEDNCLEPGDTVLNHGDYRLGNLLAEDSRLTGVLDWELAHFSDFHEDLAFGCMAVWRFARYDRPALGSGSLEDYFAAYEAESGRTVDPARFRFWTIYRTVWWALGCLKQAQVWREGQDRMLERVVISRRTSEQELDLLMLLEEDAPEEEKVRSVEVPRPFIAHGEANAGEMATAISEWLATVKDRMQGHDLFQIAVARNALGIIARDYAFMPRHEDLALSDRIINGEVTLATGGLLSELRTRALEKLEVDIPRYPALEVAQQNWLGE